jgi:hypothetical protein
VVALQTSSSQNLLKEQLLQDPVVTVLEENKNGIPWSIKKEV